MNHILIFDFIIVLLIFLRILAAFLAAPIFNNAAIPVLAKIFLAFVIAYIIFLVRDNSAVKVETGLFWLFINACKEIITGLLIGYSLNLAFYGFSYAGSLIGFDMELSMAQALNPLDNSDTNILGEAIYMGAILKYSISKPVSDLIIKYSASVFIIAIKISAPFLISFFLINVAEGIIARVIPQMQVFFVVQPLKITIGFVLLIMTTPLMMFAIKNLLKSFEDNLYILVKAMGS
ncbi:MAG: flagellar biosynthetic protein FliR [Ignavibacteriaceae bacterium]